MEKQTVYTAYHFFCLSVVLIKKDIYKTNAILGMIYNFCNNDIYYAIKGKGAFMYNINQPTQKHRIKVSNLSHTHNLLYDITITEDNYTKSSYSFIKYFKHEKIFYRNLGCFSLALSYLSNNKINFIAHSKINLSQHTAAILIANEAEAELVNFNMQKINIEDKTTNIIITNKTLINKIKTYVQ